MFVCTVYCLITVMNIRFYLFDVCVRVRASVYARVCVRACAGMCVCVCVCVCVCERVCA